MRHFGDLPTHIVFYTIRSSSRHGCKTYTFHYSPPLLYLIQASLHVLFRKTPPGRILSTTLKATRYMYLRRFTRQPVANNIQDGELKKGHVLNREGHCVTILVF